MKIRFFDKIFLRNSFKKNIDKKTVEKILSGNYEVSKPEYRECGYIIVEIKQDNGFEKTLAELIEYSEKKDFFIEYIGSIVILNSFRQEKIKNLSIKDSINEYVQNLPHSILINIRCVYGVENAKIGSLGSNDHNAFILLLEDFFKKILKIGELNYGEIMEVEKFIK